MAVSGRRPNTGTACVTMAAIGRDTDARAGKPKAGRGRGRLHLGRTTNGSMTGTGGRTSVSGRLGAKRGGGRTRTGARLAERAKAGTTALCAAGRRRPLRRLRRRAKTAGLRGIRGADHDPSPVELQLGRVLFWVERNELRSYSSMRARRVSSSRRAKECGLAATEPSSPTPLDLHPLLPSRCPAPCCCHPRPRSPAFSRSPLLLGRRRHRPAWRSPPGSPAQAGLPPTPPPRQRPAGHSRSSQSRRPQLSRSSRPPRSTPSSRGERYRGRRRRPSRSYVVLARPPAHWPRLASGGPNSPRSSLRRC